MKKAMALLQMMMAPVICLSITRHCIVMVSDHWQRMSKLNLMWKTKEMASFEQ